MAASVRELRATSRVTRFELEGVPVAYTTQSSDGRCLGDIGIVAVVGDSGDGAELWRMAQEFSGAHCSVREHARWILTQATRARIVAEPVMESWVAQLTRRIDIGMLYANHEVLETGRITPQGTP
ncbi:hypothetical protein [Streptomyces formicae]